MVIAATIPAALIGVFIKLLNLDDILENIFVVAIMLIFTAALMFLVDRLGKKGRYTEKDAPMKSAWLVGVLQAVAILPGLSRSGSTIFGGLLGRLTKEFAVKFAFIISIPIILGAGLVEMAGIIRSDEIVIDPLMWLAGFVIATVIGVFAIKLIRVLIKSSKFYLFSIYCLLASAFAFLAGFGVIG